MSIAPYAGGLSIEGGRTGILLLHGFAGTPQNLWPIAEAAWRRGYAVEAPRLPGHGTTVDDLSATRPPDWVGAALDGFERLRARCDDVVVMGISLGGTLGVHVALERADVAGLVVMAAPLFTVPGLVALIDDPSTPDPIPAPVRDVTRDQGSGVVCYDQLPKAPFRAALEFADRTGARLGELACATFFLYGAHDPLVPVSHAERARDAVPGSSLLVLRESAHELTLDRERELVVGQSLNFVSARDRVPLG